MTRILISIILWTSIMLEAHAANPAIIFGADGMALNLASGGIELSNGSRWLTLAADPTAGGGIAANEGDYGVFGPTLYIKQDSITDTNWAVVSTYVTPITTEGDIVVGDGTGQPVRLGIGANGYGLVSDGTTAVWAPLPEELALLSKGSIVTSNGTVNGEFSACADGYLLEWDSNETAGVKCTSAAALAPAAKFSFTGTNIAGTAITDDTLTELGADFTIVNDGSAWDNSTKEYTCPSTGNYIASITARFGDPDGSGINTYRTELRDVTADQNFRSQTITASLSETVVSTFAIFCTTGNVWKLYVYCDVNSAACDIDATDLGSPVGINYVFSIMEQ